MVSFLAALSPSPHCTFGRPAAIRSCSRALSLPCFLPSIKRLRRRLSSWPALPALLLPVRHPAPSLAAPCARAAPPSSAAPPVHLARRGRGGRGGLRLRLGRPVHAHVPPIYLMSSAGSGGLCHRNSPPGRP
jgi:hypothetical protein